MMRTLEKTFMKGDVIIKEGGFSNSFYVIRKGSVEVVKRKGNIEVQLAKYGPGDFFGEMSLLDPEYSKHSATIRALEETKLTIMSKEDFEKYIGQLTPGVKNLLRKMAIYLRETSQRVDSDLEIKDEAGPPDQPKEEKSTTPEPSSSDDHPEEKKTAPPEPPPSDNQPEEKP
jgi:CRP-like cAMP-binding protein